MPKQKKNKKKNKKSQSKKARSLPSVHFLFLWALSIAVRHLLGLPRRPRRCLFRVIFRRLRRRCGYHLLLESISHRQFRLNGFDCHGGLPLRNRVNTVRQRTHVIAIGGDRLSRQGPRAGVKQPEQVECPKWQEMWAASPTWSLTIFSFWSCLSVRFVWSHRPVHLPLDQPSRQSRPSRCFSTTRISRESSSAFSIEILQCLPAVGIARF